MADILQNTPDPQSVEDAINALKKLTTALSAHIGVRDMEMRIMGAVPEAGTRAFIEARRSRASQRRLWVARAFLSAERARDAPSLRQGADNLSLALHNLQLPGHLEDAERMTYAEASLRLVEYSSESMPGWRESMSRYYRNPRRHGVEPIWRGAFGLESAEILALFDQVRCGLGYQEFIENPNSLPLTTAREISDDELQIPIVNQQSRLRVCSVEIDNFRGISKRTHVDFVDKEGQPVSCLISGDNGTGKSTIVSAIEFVCQSRIGQQIVRTATGLPYPINLASGSRTAQVWLTLSDGSVRSRSLDLVERGARPSDGTVDEEFRLVPISLQRSDIVRFLNAPPQQRGMLFLGHFGEVQPLGNPPSAELMAVREELAREKKRRRDLLAGLADRIGSPAVPDSREDMEMLLQAVFYDGMTRRRWEQRFDRQAPDKAIEISKSYERLSANIKRLKDQVRRLGTSGSQPGYETRVRRLGVLLGDISNPITGAIHQIAGLEWVREISVTFGELSAMSIELTVTLQSGQAVSPESLFSEGVQDLVAVLFFLEIAQSAAARGQARILILDDVLQSVDSSIRVKLLEYILKRFASWQLFITVHDRLWREQLVNLMRRHNHHFVEREVRRWMFDHGPELRIASSDDLAALSTALNVGNTQMICAETGRLLERICDVLSYTLPISVSRRAGDRYDLGALWPGVAKKLRRTSLSSTANEVDRWLMLRNLLGAHYNLWAIQFVGHFRSSK